MKWATVALILVSAAAVAIAFGSSAKTKNAGRQIGSLKGRVEQLSREKTALETELSEARARREKEASAVNELKEALAQEQLKSKTLADQLTSEPKPLQPQPRFIEDVKPKLPSLPQAAAKETEQPVKRASSQNFTTSGADR